VKSTTLSLIDEKLQKSVKIILENPKITNSLTFS